MQHNPYILCKPYSFLTNNYSFLNTITLLYYVSYSGFAADGYWH